MSDAQPAPRGLGPGLVLVAGHDERAVLEVPSRDAVAPPELARDAPVADVVHPLEVVALPLVRQDLGAPLFYGLDRGFCQCLGADEPLRRNPRLHRQAGPLAAPDVVCVLLDLVDQSQRRQILDDLLASFVAVQSRVSAAVGIDPGLFIQHGDAFKSVSLARREVVGVMCGRDLDDSGTELGVHEVVADDREAAAH